MLSFWLNILIKDRKWTHAVRTFTYASGKKCKYRSIVLMKNKCKDIHKHNSPKYGLKICINKFILNDILWFEAKRHQDFSLGCRSSLLPNLSYLLSLITKYQLGHQRFVFVIHYKHMHYKPLIIFKIIVNKIFGSMPH